MPIRRPNNDDFMARRMDKRLSEMEASIASIYEEAAAEGTRRLERYLATFEERDAVMYARYLEEEITEDEWLRWRSTHILRTQRYQATIDSLTDVLVNADISAMALVDGNLPYVLAQSYNFTQFVGNIIAENTGLNVGTFQIYNTRTVQALIRDNPNLLPTVDIPLDQQWNRTQINRAVTQGILHGDSMDRIAERFQHVAQMDDNSAIRNARTAVTAAENMGRNESYNFIRSQGIEMVKEWSATLDDRTRDTHVLLNGTRPNEDGFFGDGILDVLMEYPADPRGEPQERYNCRCRLNIVPPEYNREVNQRNYDTWLRENYPDDYADVQESDKRRGKIEERQRFYDRIPEARRRVEERRRRRNG